MSVVAGMVFVFILFYVCALIRYYCKNSRHALGLAILRRIASADTGLQCRSSDDDENYEKQSSFGRLTLNTTLDL
uniref:Uncharacterized protein n=1 Tax=Romanomermis culicivorax TaxID=13658 RepID=A0A915I9R9_ROMCU